MRFLTFNQLNQVYQGMYFTREIFESYLKIFLLIPQFIYRLSHRSAKYAGYSLSQRLFFIS